MGSLHSPSAPTSTIPPVPFSEFVTCFQVFEPSDPGTGPFWPLIGPFHRLFAGDVENASISHRVSVWIGSDAPSPPPPPLHRRRANRAPPVLSIDLGGLKPPSFLRYATSFTDETFGNFHRYEPYKDAIDPFSAPTSIGSISVHLIASSSLVNSGKGFVDNGVPSGSAFRPSIVPPGSAFRPSIVFPCAHHWRLCFSLYSSFVGRIFLFPEPSSLHRHRWKPWDQPFDYNVFRQYLLPPTSNILHHRSPPTTARLS